MMSPVKRLAPFWVCGGLIFKRAMQSPYRVKPEPGPFFSKKAELAHAEEMANRFSYYVENRRDIVVAGTPSSIVAQIFKTNIETLV